MWVAEGSRIHPELPARRRQAADELRLTLCDCDHPFTPSDPEGLKAQRTQPRAKRVRERRPGLSIQKNSSPEGVAQFLMKLPFQRSVPNTVDQESEETLTGRLSSLDFPNYCERSGTSSTMATGRQWNSRAIFTSGLRASGCTFVAAWLFSSSDTNPRKRALARAGHADQHHEGKFWNGECHRMQFSSTLLRYHVRINDINFTKYTEVGSIK
jgi:hypothetical protein